MVNEWKFEKKLFLSSHPFLGECCWVWKISFSPTFYIPAGLIKLVETNQQEKMSRVYYSNELSGVHKNITGNTLGSWDLYAMLDEGEWEQVSGVPEGE